jgi:hypothetical protein
MTLNTKGSALFLSKESKAHNAWWQESFDMKLKMENIMN